MGGERTETPLPAKSAEIAVRFADWVIYFSTEFLNNQAISTSPYMKRVTDKLIALQFLAVVLPIAVVLIVQLVVDARRAE